MATEIGDVPGITGRRPLNVTRQLYYFQRSTCYGFSLLVPFGPYPLSQVRISDGEDAVVGREAAELGRKGPVGLVAEHNRPAPVSKLIMQRLLHFNPMGPNMDAAYLPPQQIYVRGEHHNLTLLDVGFEIINHLERRQYLLQRDRAQELNLGHKICAWNEVLCHAGGIVQD